MFLQAAAARSQKNSINRIQQNSILPAAAIKSYILHYVLQFTGHNATIMWYETSHVPVCSAWLYTVQKPCVPPKTPNTTWNLQVTISENVSLIGHKNGLTVEL